METSTQNDPNRLTLEILNMIKDQRDAEQAKLRDERRWKRVKLLFMVLIIAVPMLSYSVLFTQLLDKGAGVHIGVVKLHGAIGDDQAATRMIRAMDEAMKNPKSKGLILDINSPGGSPAQSERMRLRIDYLRKEYPDKHIVAVGGDLIASGGYLVASGAERISVLPSTLTGSIGVIHQSYGLKRVAEKLNVDVRTVHSGENKAILNEFSTMGPKEVAFIQDMTSKIHTLFIDYVRRGRGERLHENAEMFTGLFWLGDDAIKMGLVDDIATIDEVAEKTFGGGELKLYGKQSPLDSLRSLSSSIEQAASFMSLATASGLSLQ